MADVEINDLTSKASFALTDEVEIQETAGGTSKKVTGQVIADAVAGEIGSVALTVTSTLISSTKVQYLTATGATVQTFPASGSNTLVNDGDGATAGVMTLTPPSGKKLYREDGTALAADAVLYSAGDVAEFLTWNIDPSGHVRILKEGGSFSTTP